MLIKGVVREIQHKLEHIEWFKEGVGPWLFSIGIQLFKKRGVEPVLPWFRKGEGCKKFQNIDYVIGAQPLNIYLDVKMVSHHKLSKKLVIKI